MAIDPAIQAAADKIKADVDALLALIPAPVPPPSPPPSPVVAARFARVAYAGAQTTDLPKRDVFILNANATGIASAKALKAANPNVICLVYQTIDSAVSTDLAGVSTCVPYSLANQNESWFLHDSLGKRIPYSTSYPSQLLLDFANPQMQQAAIPHVAATLATGPWDGVFLDNVRTLLAFEPPAVKLTYPTDKALQDAVVSALTTIAGSIRSSGKLAIGNFTGNDLTIWQRYLGYMDGAMQESWTDGGAGIAQQKPYFSACLQQVIYAEANKKMVLLHTYNGTQAGFVYALCSMLLVAGGNARLCTSTLNYSTSNVWFPECDKALQLGSPLGSYTVAGSVYTRKFQNGTVTVDTTALTAAIT